MKSQHPHQPHKRSLALPTIAVVGSVCIVRECLALALAARLHWNVADGGDGEPESVQRLVDLHPRAVLVRLSSERADLLVRRLSDAIPDARIVGISPSHDESALLSLIEAGVTGLILDEDSLGEVQVAIGAALRGEFHFPPQIIAALVGCLAESHRNGNGHEPLPLIDGRQRDVLLLVEQGLTNKEIAARLSIAEGTVKTHVHRFLGKLGSHRRGEAASWLRGHSQRLTQTYGDRDGES